MHNNIAGLLSSMLLVNVDVDFILLCVLFLEVDSQHTLVNPAQYCKSLSIRSLFACHRIQDSVLRGPRAHKSSKLSRATNGGVDPLSSLHPCLTYSTSIWDFLSKAYERELEKKPWAGWIRCQRLSVITSSGYNDYRREAVRYKCFTWQTQKTSQRPWEVLRGCAGTCPYLSHTAFCTLAADSRHSPRLAQVVDALQRSW